LKPRILREHCMALNMLFQAEFDTKINQKSRISEGKTANYEGHL